MTALKLSIVTPSYNQGRFIYATIESVLSQTRRANEYLVMDGGSKDETVDILRLFGDQIIWVSEPDGGQAAAVNKGIERASGDVIGWINSDDIYYPHTFETVMEIFETHPEVNVIYGHADHINEDGSYREDYYTEKWDYERLKEICYICQPAVFFRKETVKKYGMLDPTRNFAMDYDLWLRMGKGEEFYFINKKFAGSRLYNENKTLGQVGKVHLEIMDVLKDNCGYVPERWLEGSAHSTARSEGFSVETPLSYHRYKMHITALIQKFVERYKTNPDDELKKYPYKYQALNIGIDISVTMDPTPTGVPYFARCLTESLLKIDTQNRFFLYSAFHRRYAIHTDGGVSSRRPNVIKKYCPINQDDCIRLQKAFASEAAEPIMGKLEYPDVVLCPAFYFSKNLAKHTATVFVLYDVSFLEHPEYSTKANYDNCYDAVFKAALYADIFIAISENTKKAFLRYFPFVDADRVIVALGGFRGRFVSQVDRKKELASLGMKAETPFWLCVGTVEPRKNFISLIRAYKKLKESGETYPLYIAGGKGWLNSEIYQEVENTGLSDDITFLGYVTDDQLNALYRSCYATIYPSYYEGFGLPILEAMAAGAPVISSNTTSMPEVGGDAVLYIDPYDVDSITAAMQKLQADPDLRKDFAERGHKRALENFSWEKCAEITYRSLYKAIAHFDGKQGKPERNGVQRVNTRKLQRNLLFKSRVFRGFYISML